MDVHFTRLEMDLRDGKYRYFVETILYKPEVHQNVC